MATWTLKRILILAAAVIIGLVVLRNGFPSNASQDITGPPSSPASPSPTVTSPGSTTSPSPTGSPRIEGVVVLVLNGTDQDGLAADVATMLENEGYTVQDPDNAPNRQRTTIIHAADFLPEAELMKEQFFPTAALKNAGPSFPAGVDLQVILGADFLGN